MKPHQTFLELAAMEIDYPLSTSERRHLDEHLAGCGDCVRSASALRADAVAIGSLPALTLSDRRGDLILAAALRPDATHRPLRLVAIAALLALLITGSIAVGALLLNRMNDDLAIIVPAPTPTASPSAGPSPRSSATPIAVPPFGTFSVTSEDQLQSWIEVVAPDGAVTRLRAGSNAAWLGPDVIYECVSPTPDVPAICSADGATPGGLRIIADGSNPAPAPIGRSIALNRGTIDLGETWIVDFDGTSGSNLRRLAQGRLNQWSPDGAWLAGQTDPATFQVSIIRADGTGLRVLAPGHGPAWSPSSDRIVYVFNDDKGAASLRTVDVATGEVQVLYAPDGVALSAPAWLGDRGWVFVQDGNVWRLDVGASAPVQLTTGLEIDAGSATDDPLAVSADDRWVAFTTGIDTTSRVGVVSVNGDLDVVYPGKAGMSDPQWAPEAPPAPPAPTPLGEGDLGYAWTEAAVPAAAGRPDGVVEAVTAGGPGFVAVGRGCVTTIDPPICEGVVWTSTDGRTWARGPASDATDTGAVFSTGGPEIGMFDVAAGTPGVVAIGYAARPNLQATIWFSPDAASWERIPLGLDGAGTAPGDRLAVRVYAVTWDGRQFVAVGEDRSDFNGRNFAKAQARAAVWTSPDGRTWTRVPHTAALDVGKFFDTLEDPATGGMHDVVAGPAGLVAVGSVCDGSPNGCQPASWTSTDGHTWERAPDMLTAPGALTSVVASPSAYVATGLAKCDGCSTIALTSTDGRSWGVQEFDHLGHFNSLAAIGDRLFAISSDPSMAVWTSKDGTDWLPSAVVGGPTTGAGVATWHVAGTPDTAVWLGSPEDRTQPAVWVSVRTP